MSDIRMPSDSGGISDPYVSTRSQRRKLAALSALFSAVYLVSVSIVGPTEVGKILEYAAMCAAAAGGSALAFAASRKADKAVRLLWLAFGSGLTLYSVTFGLQAARVAGCEPCRPAAAGMAASAWVSFAVVYWGALRLAREGADIRLWTIEVLDATVVLVSAVTWVGVLSQLKGLEVPRPVVSAEFVEFIGVPLIAVGTVFVFKSVSEAIGAYKLLQVLFLGAVAGWIMARSWNAPGYERATWMVFSVYRAATIFSGLLIPAYAVAAGAKLDILNVHGPEERPVTDVSVAVVVLGIVVVVARLFVGQVTPVFEVSLPVLALVSLLLVARLALTSEYHRYLEDSVTESSAGFKNLVEGANHGMLEIALDGTVSYCNEAALEIIGVPREELLGRDLSRVIEPRDLFSQKSTVSQKPVALDEHALPVVPRLRSGSRVIGELRLKKGHSRYVELAPSERSERDDGPLRVILRDVTVEVEQRLEVQRLIDDLRQKNLERSVLMREMLETAESERHSIASQLHDGPVQHITLLALKIDLLRRKFAGEPSNGAASECQNIAAEIRPEAHYLAELSNALSPVVRPDENLATSLETMLRSIFDLDREAGRVRWKLVAPDEVPLSDVGKIGVYRCIQAVALDARVFGADRADIELVIEGQWLKVRVSTDAPLDSPRARGVSRAKVWVQNLGGYFEQHRKGKLYVAAFCIPEAPRQAS